MTYYSPPDRWTFFARAFAYLCLAVQKYTSAVDDGRVMQFKQQLLNRTLVNHVIKSVRVKSELSCESFCFADDDCMSINIGALMEDNKHFCELSRSDHVLHPGDLKIRSGFMYNPVWNYCSSSPCPRRHRCQNGFTGKGYRCTEHLRKINKSPVCYGARDDNHGVFTIKEIGVIYTFKLVHIQGSLSCSPNYPASLWACTHPSYGDQRLNTVITFANKTVLLLAKYTRTTKGCGYYSYRIEGVGDNSTELPFDDLPSPMLVSVGQEFQIWYGGDLINCGQFNNAGITCVDVYAWYT